MSLDSECTKTVVQLMPPASDEKHGPNEKGTKGCKSQPEAEGFLCTCNYLALQLC